MATTPDPATPEPEAAGDPGNASHPDPPATTVASTEPDPEREPVTSVGGDAAAGSAAEGGAPPSADVDPSAASSAPSHAVVEDNRRKGFRSRHTAVQWLMLGVNILVIVACFAAATVLLIGKNLRESLTAAPRASIETTVPPDTSPTVTTIAASPEPVPGGTAPPETAPPETFPAVDAQADNFLITGDDNNACVDPDSPWAGAVEDRESLGSRSDTIMVMRIDPTTRAAAVLSFPRDLYVKVPGKGTTRINNAYQEGQYDLMAQTLYDNFGVPVDHFVQIDFCAFKTIVDAVGGVSVPFSTPIRDPNVGLDIAEAGCHSFGGDEALAYVRTRKLQYLEDGDWKSDGTSDYGRITRQQDFLRRMLKTALDKGMFNPSVARGILDAARNYVVFDQGFSLDDMLSFAGLIRYIPPASINTYQVEATPRSVGGAAVLIPTPNTETMKAILAVFRGEAPLAGAPSEVEVTAPTVGPTDTTVATATTVTPSTAAATTAAPTTAVGAGQVPSTIPGAAVSTTAAPVTTSTTTSTTVAPTDTIAVPVVTNPESIAKGYFPDKNVEC